jgi:hypothetical protein
MLSRYAVPVFLLLAIAIGCKFSSNDKESHAYIGGEIVNPKNTSVAIYDADGELLDSIMLDNNNRFNYKIPKVQSGLYTIAHGGEYQMLIVEPNDSIMFRLNTYDFDESLVFTGEGAKKNNYLIKTYLYIDDEAKKLVKNAKMEPEEFDAFVENRRQKQLNEFYKFLENNNESDFFKTIIESYINYSALADKEIYPFAYFGNNKLIHVKDLPESFYSYRDTINYNAAHLSSFFAYNRFLFSHIDNLALNAYYKSNVYHSKFNRHSMDYNKSKLDLIDSIIENEIIKNRLLKYKARDYISHNHTQAEAAEMLDYYLQKSTNQKDKEYMMELVSNLELLRQGNPLPDLALVNYDQTEHNLNSIITKPTIIYFWSSHSKSQYRNSHYKVKQLKEKFPDMDFISIYINDNDDKYWKDVIRNYNFPTQKEYKFKNSKKALKTLAVNYLNKAIIVDENSNILHPNANIFHSKFDKTLKELTQKSISLTQ